MRNKAAAPFFFLLGVVIISLLACAAFVRNRTWRDPVTLWSDIVAKNQQELDAFISLGNAYLESGMLWEALNVFRYVQSREATTSIRIYPNIGNVYIAMKRFEQAEDLFSRVLGINADDELSYAGRGKARFAQGRYAEALADFQEAIRRNPSQARYYYYRGETFLQLRDRQRARADLARSCDGGWEEACDRAQVIADDAEKRLGGGSSVSGADRQ